MGTPTNTPLACNRTAFNTEQGKRHQTLFRQLFDSVEDIEELADGFAFRLAMDPLMCIVVAEFITLERLCCPFLNFVLEVEPGEGPLWLKLTGPDNVKQFLQAEFDQSHEIRLEVPAL